MHGALWRRFGVTEQPAFAFLDKAGKLSPHKGGMGDAELARRLAALR
ncbi:MAG TPA: hypothetical protein VHV82_19510 [Sporichthyaceae bacterium]|nr:hypothetical protein [Sporichthyaceae bacterium]